MKYSLSKSRYCSGLQCPKMLWLKKRVPDALDPSCHSIGYIKERALWIA